MPKAIKINFRTEFLTKDHRLDLNQWLDYVKEIYEGYGYNYEFIGISDVQLNIERTKPSLGSYTELQRILRGKTKSVLRIRNNKLNCLRLCITAAFFPAADHATGESKYINNLVDDWGDNGNTYDYLTRTQNKYNINIWFYRTSAEDKTKVEILQKCSNFIKSRTNVRIIVWNEQAALIKDIKVLLERPNTKNTKFWFCDNCSPWFPNQQKYEPHECCTQIKQKIVCPKLKQIKFKNHYKQQEMKNVIYRDIKCYMDSIDKKIVDNTYKISDQVPIAIAFSWSVDYKSNFGLDCIKDCVKELLEIETEKNFKLNKSIILNKEY